MLGTERVYQLDHLGHLVTDGAHEALASLSGIASTVFSE